MRGTSRALTEALSDSVGNEHARKRCWARNVAGFRRMRVARPNDAHHALATLERRGRIVQLVTQNVDGLHHAAAAKTSSICTDASTPFAASVGGSRNANLVLISNARVQSARVCAKPSRTAFSCGEIREVSPRKPPAASATLRARSSADARMSARSWGESNGHSARM